MFKFFAVPWSGMMSMSPPTLEQQREQSKKALELFMTDFTAHIHAKWEREFRVFFDGSQPIGLGFQQAPAAIAPLISPFNTDRTLSTSKNGSLAGEQLPASQYECVVKEIMAGGLAFKYNAHCREVGDYSRLIVENLRVRMINHEDLAKVPYTDVLQKMRDAKPAFSLTFVDISSRLITQGRRNSMGSLTIRPEKSSFIEGRAHLTRRRSSCVGINNSSDGRRNSVSVMGATSYRRKSSLMALHGEENCDSDMTDILVEDLEKKNHDISQQLLSIKNQAEGLQRERDELILAKEAVVSAKEQLLQQKCRVEEERDALATAHQHLKQESEAAIIRRVSITEQQQLETVRLMAELEATQSELTKLQQQHELLVEANENLQTRFAEQLQVADENQSLVQQLQHERDALTLRWQELQHEHQDAKAHVEELHEQLVEAQRKIRSADVKVQVLQAERDEEEARIAPTTDSELDRILVHERRRSSIRRRNSINSNHEDEVTSTNNEHIAAVERLKHECAQVEKHRDQLLVELTCNKENFQALQEQVHALEVVNAASKQLVATLHDDLRAAQERERTMRLDFETQLQSLQRSTQTSQNELQTQITELRRNYDAVQKEKEQAQLALAALEDKTQARLAARSKEQEFLTQFKHKLACGIVVTKYGSHGNPHQRLLFSDPQCRWISWKPVTANMSLSQPKTDAKADTSDLVAVIAGANTEVFLRQPPDSSSRCFSLVFVRPCRTLDIEVETIERCQSFVRGFQLLHDEVVPKKREVEI